MKDGGQSRLVIAGTVSGLLWFAGLVVACFLCLMGFVGTGFAPLLSAVVLLVSLPVTLIGIWSFRVSAIASVVLFLCDMLTSAMPRLSIASYLGSGLGRVLFSLAVLNLLTWGVSPFASIVAMIRRVRDEY